MTKGQTKLIEIAINHIEHDEKQEATNVLKTILEGERIHAECDSVSLPGLGMFKKWLHDNGMYQCNAEQIHKFLTTPI